MLTPQAQRSNIGATDKRVALALLAAVFNLCFCTSGCLEKG